MSGDVQVRFCESLRGKFPWATRLVFWCESNIDAKNLLTVLQDYLCAHRQLQLKSDIQINHSQHGITYCGYRILPATILLTRRKRRRYQYLRQSWEQAWQDQIISMEELQRVYHAVHAITLHSDSLMWRKRNLHLYPPLTTY